MPYQQFEAKPKTKFSPRQGWTIALFNPNFAQTYYLAHVVQIDPQRFMSLVGDYSFLLEQARMCPEVHFAAVTADGDEVTGHGAITILGRLKDLKNESNGFVAAVNLLKKNQVFLNDSGVLVEFSMQSLRDSQSLLSCGLSLKT